MSILNVCSNFSVHFLFTRYQLAENTDGQLKRMVQDLKDIIDHLNTANTPMDTNDPVSNLRKGYANLALTWV